MGDCIPRLICTFVRYSCPIVVDDFLEGVYIARWRSSARAIGGDFGDNGTSNSACSKMRECQYLRT